jgi:hypothetical protein
MKMKISSQKESVEISITTENFESYISSVKWNNENIISIKKDDFQKTITELAELHVPQMLSSSNVRNDILCEAAIILSHINLIASIPRNRNMINDMIFDEFYTPKTNIPGSVPVIYFLPEKLSVKLIECSRLSSLGYLRSIVFTGWAAEATNFYTPLTMPRTPLESTDNDFLNKVLAKAKDRMIRWQNGVR